VAEAAGSDDALGAAEEALAGAQWKRARALFERALAGGETPEALEGLSWAAWWLDDADAVFDARERAYRLYRQAGDNASAARMATWMAIDQVDFNGAVAVASGWLQRARRLLDPVEQGAEHGWLAMQEGYVAHLRGEADRAAELGGRAAELGRRFGVPDLEMLGLGLEGATLVAGAQVEEGMRCLDEATALALEGDATVPISSAWACCFLVSACTAVRDFERASEWCDRIAEFAERYGSRYMLAFCGAGYGAVHLWRGRWAEAEAVLEASVEDYSHSRPTMMAGPLAGIAELRRRQGRPEDAARALERAGETPEALLCRARLALDEDDPVQATELARRVLRNLPPHSELDRAPALEVLVESETVRGALDSAAASLEELREVATRAGTAGLRASADRAEALLAAARGEHDRARHLLEDALHRFDRSGALPEAALTRVELARALLAMWRPDEAEREAVRACDLLSEIGAEAEAAQARRLREVARRESEGPSGPDEVTPREREVLALLAEGLTNQQIAERLVLSEHTVHRHVTNILRKLDLPSRTAAAAHAVRSGLLD
jgi:LuxR family transcriptional regulator, maltose regulon positive regulatory protein